MVKDHGEQAEDPIDFPVVAIGASAGGLESLERLFTHLPTDTGMAFVVLQHLSPDFKSLMDELLARRTAMAVRQAEHEVLLQPNTVYLLPPMKEMIVRQRRLLLSDRDPRHGLALPIDLFFRSLAHDVGDRAIAVVLSGSGSDGSRGIQDVSKAGGIVFCESPDTAKFNGMPLSAMRTGTVDHVLPPEEIAAGIATFAPNADPATLRKPLSEVGGVDGILQLLREEYGIDFSHYKISTVTRRIERRLALNRSLDLDRYVEQLRSDPRELNLLYEDLLIGVTRFFRDDAAFATLEHRVIPDIIERTPPGEQIRVWVAGCATGQEAYSIAIVLHEQLAARRLPVHVKILATDVHGTSLDIAGAGLYSEQQLAGVSEERLHRFFTLKPEGYQISQALRECIVFAPHNLIRDAPFTKLDLVTCRNLLIYLQPEAQHTVLTLFHFALKAGGFLFLGSSESPGGLLDEFDTIDEHAKVYRKRRDISLPRDFKLPMPRGSAAPRTPAPAVIRGSGINTQLVAVYDRLLDRFMPPSFLADADGHLVDTFGGMEALLKVKARRPSQLLLEMLEGELRTAVAGGMHRVHRDGQGVRYDGIPVPDHNTRYALVIEPVRDAQGTLTHVLISLTDPASGPAALVPPFTDVAAPVREQADEPHAAYTVTRDQIQALETELASTRQNLQAAIEELETTNEELQATNEELIASNEELQSTNEELHSVNEELYTVNAEYQKKNAELQELNNDIEHLLNGTDVATMFLDRELRIRKFTPRIAETFQVIPQDIGRPLRTFTHDLAHATLLDDLDRVLHEGTTVEAQTWDRRGRCLFMRMLPYYARAKEADAAPMALGIPRHNAVPDGVVLTLTDISALEQARARLAQLSAIVESSDDAIVGNSLDGIVSTWNNGAVRLYGYTPEEAIGRHISFLYAAERKGEIEDILRMVREGRAVDRFDTFRVRQDGTLVDVSVTFSPILDRAGGVAGISEISRDITQLVRARREIAEREEQIRLLLDSTAEAIYGIDLNGICIFCNPACARMLGYDSPAALVGKQMHPLIHHTRADGSPYPPEQSLIHASMRERQEVHVDDDILWRADGTPFTAEYWSHPIYRDSTVIGAVVTFLDITARKRAQDEIQEGVRRREQFLAMLSHELRNPLAAILSATRVLEGASYAGDPSCSEAGRVVERQAKHMARLLDDLLDMARITRGRIMLRTEVLDLRDTARSAIEALGPFLAERESKLVVHIPEEPVPVIGDPARLHQIQANLLSNASKYSPVGSTIHFELRRSGNEAVIRVSDQGRGIERDVLPRIFDLFVQGDESLARSDGGLGIGLTLLRSLVELHRGRVIAESEGAGRGSVFTVSLPIAADAAPEAAPATFSALPRSLVIVEDQADARRMLQLLCESEGLEVFTAENGREGADLIERVRPDLALVDLGLPVMSGYDLARRIRRNPACAHTRLIALSGYGQDADIQAALAAGFDEHITKPPDPARLDELLFGRGRTPETRL